MENFFHVQKQSDGSYSLTLTGNYSNKVWSCKYFGLEIFEVAQLLGGN